MKKDNKKGYSTEVKTTIDHESGEVVKTEIIEKIYIEKEPDYVKLYLDDIARLKNLPQTTSALMSIIVKNMGYNNLFFAFKPLKEMICEELNMPMNTLNKGIDNLKKANLLLPIKSKRGCYLVDPNLFARGSWTDIKKLRLIIDYNADGTKTLSSNAPAELKQLALNF